MGYSPLPCPWTILPLSSLLPEKEAETERKEKETDKGRGGGGEIKPLDMSDETSVSAMSAISAIGLIARNGEYWRAWVLAELVSLVGNSNNHVIALGMYEDDKEEGGRLCGYAVLRMWPPNEEGGVWGLHVLDYVCGDRGGEGEGLMRMCVFAARALGEKEEAKGMNEGKEEGEEKRTKEGKEGEGKEEEERGRRVEVRWPGCVSLPVGVKGQERQDDAGWMYR
jgi:hypothetical protein